MSGYPAWSLFADEAVLAESISRSPVASVRGPRDSSPDKLLPPHEPPYRNLSPHIRGAPTISSRYEGQTLLETVSSEQRRILTLPLAVWPE